MKGWIKVHIIPDDKEMNIRSADISTVGTGVLKSDETKEATYISLNIDCCSSSYAVTETVEEVLALIEEAENGEEKNGLLPLLTSIKAEKNKKSLYEELEKVADECQTHKDCDSCPYLAPEGEEVYWACRAFGETPYDYDLDIIPEE